MKIIYKQFFGIIKFTLIFGSLVFVSHTQIVNAQNKPITFPAIITALNSNVPNPTFRNKTEVIEFLITNIKEQKVAQPLTNDIEGLLRQSGATDLLIQTIKENVVCNDTESVAELYNKHDNNYQGTLEEKTIALDAARKFVERFAACDNQKSRLDELKTSIPKLEAEIPEPILIDEFGNIAQGDTKSRLDNFYNQLQNNPSATGYIIIYGSAKTIAKKEKFINQHISLRGFPRDRIVIVNGGIREDVFIQFWIVPAGATPPSILK